MKAFGTGRAIAAVGSAVVLAVGVAACGGDDEASTSGGGGGGGDEAVKVGLITKTETNPFFVKMKEGATAAAESAGAELQSFAGKKDGDNESQVAAVENLISAGAKGFMITANDSKAIVPSLDKARQAGLLVIALDTPIEPRRRRRRDVRHRQLSGRPADRPVGEGEVREGGQGGEDRDARPQPGRGLGRRAARPGLPRGLRRRRRRQGQDRRRVRPADRRPRRDRRRRGGRPHGDGEPASEGRRRSTSSTRSTSRPRRARTRR